MREGEDLLNCGISSLSLSLSRGDSKIDVGSPSSLSQFQQLRSAAEGAISIIGRGEIEEGRNVER